MQSVKRAFWNSEQHRLRAFWRLVLQLLLFGAIVFVLQILVGLLGFVIAVIQQGISPEQFGDPAGVPTAITNSPVVLIASMLAIAIAMAVSVWLAGRLFDRRRFADFGFHLDRGWWLDFGFGLALGAILMVGIFLIELAAGWVTVTDIFSTYDPDAGFFPIILLPLVNYLCVGFYEELFSRGYQLRNLAEGFGSLGYRFAILLATAVTSAVFGFLHATNPNASLFSTFNIVIAGVFLAMGYILTGELAIPIGLHISWNFFQGNVFGFSVSGGGFGVATFINTEQGGPDLWTGGAFGPEAGLLGLGAVLLGILLTILWVRLRRGDVKLHQPLTAPELRTVECATE